MKSVADIFRSYAMLDEEGRHRGGTDKMSNHSYGEAYSSIIDNTFSDKVTWFEHLGQGYPVISKAEPRSQVKLMMEVGVADGASLLAWSEIFHNATCVGLDIHHSNRAHGERIEFFKGDATKREDCERAAGGRKFDIIIDDATHHLQDLLRTLYWLWPSVRPGGLYVVEEWEGVGGDRARICDLFPQAYIVGTCGPHIQDEPLVVLRKPL